MTEPNKGDESQAAKPQDEFAVCKTVMAVACVAVGLGYLFDGLSATSKKTSPAVSASSAYVESHRQYTAEPVKVYNPKPVGIYTPPTAKTRPDYSTRQSLISEPQTSHSSETSRVEENPRASARSIIRPAREQNTVVAAPPPINPENIHEVRVHTASGTVAHRYERLEGGKWNYLGVASDTSVVNILSVASTRPSYSSPSYGSSSLNSGSSSPSSGTRYYDPTYRPPVGEHYVQGHVRSDGTYVSGHYKTNSDNSFWNNYSSKGNFNPHTGGIGTKMPSYGSGRPRGRSLRLGGRRGAGRPMAGA